MLLYLAMASSQMQSSALLSRILLILKPPVLLRDPVRVLRSIPGGGPHIDTDLMKRRNIRLLDHEIKNSSHGDSLVALEDGVGAEVVVQIPVSLGPVDISNSNDNYRLGPTLVQTVIQKLDSSGVEKTLKNKTQDVFYNVVDPVPFVKCSGLPQKKGLSPVIQKNKIKDVEGVFCVSQCVSVPHAQSVPSAVQTLAVGGRLQNFWKKWSSLGATPRVVSILKEGYTFLFKMSPPVTRSPVVQSGYANPVRNGI